MHLNHRRIVEAMRNSRPVDVYGRRQFLRSMVDDPLCTYVCDEIDFHLRNGWEENMEKDSLAMSDWLGDVPQDEIVSSTSDPNRFCEIIHQYVPSPRCSNIQALYGAGSGCGPGSWC